MRAPDWRLRALVLRALAARVLVELELVGPGLGERVTVDPGGEEAVDIGAGDAGAGELGAGELGAGEPAIGEPGAGEAGAELKGDGLSEGTGV